ncbi:glycosyltransferase [Lacrimispora indolis]|uniref:glycosyltransferase n=1 Tax=Lacrimispora indolis TaxID=69825 RepID=UPI0035667DE5
MSMQLSCVILNYNDAETTEKLVMQIADYDVLHQIIVVDNASTDDSLERLRKLESDANASQSCKVRVISADHNGGYGSGNNLGVRCGAEQGATHVLIANPDVVFSEQSLKAMLAIFARHPEVGIVTTRIRDARFPNLKNGWPLRSFIRELLSMGPVSRRLLGKTFDYPDSYFAGRSAVYVGAVHGSMLMVDTEKFLEAGGYDEGIFLYEEEQVLGRRMQNAGYRSVLLLNQHYDHEHSASISKSFSDAMKRQRLREESTLYYMKHYLHISPLQEQIAKLWFAGIRLEMQVAKLVGIKI